LQVANPDGIQALVVDAKGRQESANGHGHGGADDVVGLKVVQFFSDLAAVRAVAPVLALEVAFEFASGLDQPMVTEGDENYRIDFRDDLSLAGLNVGKETGVASEDRDWVIRAIGLRDEQRGKDKNTEK